MRGVYGFARGSASKFPNDPVGRAPKNYLIAADIFFTSEGRGEALLHSGKRG
jgi:hypothetical protein